MRLPELARCIGCLGTGHPTVLNKARTVLGVGLISDAGVPCPECGGSGIRADLIEAAVVTYEQEWTEWWKDDPDWKLAEAETRRMFAAVLAAVFAAMEEE